MNRVNDHDGDDDYDEHEYVSDDDFGVGDEYNTIF